MPLPLFVSAYTAGSVTVTNSETTVQSVAYTPAELEAERRPPCPEEDKRQVIRRKLWRATLLRVRQLEGPRRRLGRSAAMTKAINGEGLRRTATVLSIILGALTILTLTWKTAATLAHVQDTLAATVKEVARINEEGTKQCQAANLDRVVLTKDLEKIEAQVRDIARHVGELEGRVDNSVQLQQQILREVRRLNGSGG